MNHIDKLTSQQALLPMMHKLTKELRAIMTSEFQAHNIDLSMEQAIVLRILGKKDARPQSELAIVTARDKTSLTRLLSTMERKKLIRRKKSNEDKRVNLVYITDQALEEITRATPIMLGLLNRAMMNIEAERIEQTKKLIKEIYLNLNLTHEE